MTAPERPRARHVESGAPFSALTPTAMQFDGPVQLTAVKPSVRVVRDVRRGHDRPRGAVPLLGQGVRGDVDELSANPVGHAPRRSRCTRRHPARLRCIGLGRRRGRADRSRRCRSTRRASGTAPALDVAGRPRPTQKETEVHETERITELGAAGAAGARRCCQLEPFHCWTLGVARLSVSSITACDAEDRRDARDGAVVGGRPDTAGADGRPRGGRHLGSGTRRGARHRRPAHCSEHRHDRCDTPRSQQRRPHEVALRSR